MNQQTQSRQADDKDIKFTGVRGAIAQHMMHSLQQSAQLTYMGDACIDGLLADRQARSERGEKLSPEVYLIKAVSQTLSQHPDFNGVTSVDHYTLSESHNIAIAVSSPIGLVTVTLREVNTLALEEISEMRRQLLDKAMKGLLKPSDMSGGTFTISNLGGRPIRYFTPILNAKQIAILGIGKTLTTPMIDKNGELYVSQQLPLSLTTDHRVVDGDPDLIPIN